MVMLDQRSHRMGVKCRGANAPIWAIQHHEQMFIGKMCREIFGNTVGLARRNDGDRQFA